MLTGTDLASAYAQDYDPSPKRDNFNQPNSFNPGNMQEAPQKKTEVANPVKNMDPNFLTSDQKLHLISSELQKQKEMFEMNKNNNYVDKLLSKKRDIIKLLTISFVVLFAISAHYFFEYYLRRYLEENALSSGKELLVRIAYPILVLFLLWNIKAFSK